MSSKQKQLEKAERAWYRAKAHAEQAADRVSDCERKVARLKEELIYAEILGRTRPEPKGQSAEKARKTGGKRLKGILIEVRGGVVSYVQFNGKPVTAYHLFDWDELLGDGDTRKAWEGLSTEEQQFLRDRYPAEFAAIQRRLKEEVEGTTPQS